jgi:hypothetical protein
MRGHLSQTIDKDLGVFKENMRKKLKVSIRAVDAAMSFKKAGSKRASLLSAAKEAAAATGEAGEAGKEELAVRVKVEGTEEAL